ncbi:MAG: glycosyltransferase family 39 protein [Pyrinomonadaceae bacterium]|nr:glycosyltransferase family 39 protein [Pyrinomonadaceae bacterium]
MIQYLGLFLLASGFFAGAIYAAVYLVKESRVDSEPVFRSDRSSAFLSKGNLGLMIVLVCVITLGAFLRFDSLDSKTLSHPEVYVPGIELPENISEPPPRNTTVPLIWFHFHGEPHPPAYYFVMFVWTKVAGTSLSALRLPSVLFGILSIIFTFLVACELFNKTTGVVAAGLIAFHGHHIYWSQNARMYAMTCFLGLLATWFLVKALKEPRGARRAILGAGYVAAACLGVYTEILFWVLLASQMIFTLFCQQKRVLENMKEASPGMVFRLQFLIVMLGAPMWAHAVYTGRQSPFEPVSGPFFTEYAAFGFIFERDIFSVPARFVSEPILIGAAMLAILLAAGAFFPGKLISGRLPNDNRSPIDLNLIPAALFSIVSLIGFSLVARRDRGLLLAVCIVPAAAALLPKVVVSIANYWRSNFQALSNSSILCQGRMLIVVQAFFPVGLIAFLSLFNSLLASRLFLVFTPYFLILIGGGLVNLSRSKLMLSIAVVLTGSIYFYGFEFYRDYPTEAVDYKFVSSQLLEKAENGDAVFVHRRSWITSPIFYFLHNKDLKLVAEDFYETTQNCASRRVWLINFEGQPPKKEMIEALRNYRQILTQKSRNAEAVLFECDARISQVREGPER